MSIMQVKDCNGKTFTIDDNTFKFNGDLVDSASGNSINTVSDSRQRINFENNVQIVDSKGNKLDSAKILDAYTKNNSSIAGLLIDIEATHSGKNHNFTVYYEDSMEKDAESFLNPFNKPFLMNHDENCEPIGRIVKASTGESSFTQERSAINVQAKVTDETKYAKFLDGRYKTVSIGGTMGTVTCSICGKTILKNNKFKFCGHWRGETYKDEVCYWGAKDIEYNELSVVNNPADDFAQIKKITVLNNSDDTTQQINKEENSMEKGNTTVVTKDSVNTIDGLKESVCNLIDSMLGSINNSVEDNKEEPQENPTPEEPEGEEQPEQTEDAPSGEEENARIIELEQQVQDANEQIISLQKELEDAKSNLENSNQEIESLKDKCISLAQANKNFVVDSIIEKEITLKVTDEKDKESRKEELLKLSMVELNSITVEKPEEDVHDFVPPLQNPSLADTKEDGNSDNTDSNKNDISVVKSIDDYTNEIINKLSR